MIVMLSSSSHGWCWRKSTMSPVLHFLRKVSLKQTQCLPPLLAESLLISLISCCGVWLGDNNATLAAKTRHMAGQTLRWLIATPLFSQIQEQEDKMQFRDSLDGSKSLLAHFSRPPERLHPSSELNTVRKQTSKY